MSREQRGYILAKEIVRVVVEAGPEGVTAGDVVRAVDSLGAAPAKPSSVSSMLSRMRRDGSLTIRGGRYSVPARA